MRGEQSPNGLHYAREHLSCKNYMTEIIIGFKYLEFKEKTIKTFEKEIEQRGCIGSIAEIYDSKRPQEPKGAIAQAWSVAEVLRIVM